MDFIETVSSEVDIFLTDDDKGHLIAEQVRCWGNAASIALLNPSCQIFHLSGLNGVIGYKAKMGCAVVFGEPICSPKDWTQLVQAFHAYCKEKKWTVIYTVVSKTFVDWALQSVCHSLVEFGEELIFDPCIDPKIGAKGRKLRNKLSRSFNEGVLALEYTKHDETLEQAMKNVATVWLQGRQGPQIYLAPIDLFAFRPGKRWFYAIQGSKVIGVLVLNRLEAADGWLFNLVLSTPNAPQGTSELLITTALETLQQEGCRFATSGAFPKDELGEIKGFGPFSTWISQKGFKVAKQLFHLNNRKNYWKKFHPMSRPSYLLFSEPRLSTRQVMGLISALNASF